MIFILKLLLILQLILLTRLVKMVLRSVSFSVFLHSPVFWMCCGVFALLCADLLIVWFLQDAAVAPVVLSQGVTAAFWLEAWRIRRAYRQEYLRRARSYVKTLTPQTGRRYSEAI